MSAEAKQILWLAGDYCRCCPAEIAEFLGLPVREIITTLRVYG